jgi:NADPH2:quinone reductase
MMAERRYPYPVYPSAPHVLGRDGVGTVIDIGEGVDDVRVGDQRVLLRSQVGLMRWGMFAEKVAVPASALAEVPPNWTAAESSSAAVVYLSAYRALTMWEPLKPGSVVLVTGASGGVGVATVQLATAMGHTVVALSRSAEKQQRLRDIGATFTFDPEDKRWLLRVKEAVGSRGVQLAVDTIGGTQLPDVIETMGDRKTQLGWPTRRSGAPIDTGTLFSRWLRIGAMALSLYTPEQHRATWRELIAIMARAEARPLIDRVFPFEELPHALKGCPAARWEKWCSTSRPDAVVHTVTLPSWVSRLTPEMRRSSPFTTTTGSCARTNARLQSRVSTVVRGSSSPSSSTATVTWATGSAEADVQRCQAEDLPAAGPRGDDDDTRAGLRVQRLDPAAVLDVCAVEGRHDHRLR